MSPDVKSSIHVGDRVLEINGTPIRNVPLDEVGARPGRAAGGPWCLSPSTPPQRPQPSASPPQIDLLIQETSRLLQLTLEHDPHDSLGHGPGPAPSPLGSPMHTPSGEVGSSARQKPVL